MQGILINVWHKFATMKWQKNLFSRSLASFSVAKAIFSWKFSAQKTSFAGVCEAKTAEKNLPEIVLRPR
jgi:hypothetical protein